MVQKQSKSLAKKKPARQKSKAKKPRKKVAPENRPLTGKQEAWCRWMVAADVNFNALESARRAGYKGTDGQLGVMGHDNRKKPNVAKYLKKLTDEALAASNVTVERVLRKLDVVYAKAIAAGKFGPAVRAAELHGKYLKMFVDRIENVQTIDDVSDEELIALIIELLESGNVDISAAITGNGSIGGLIPGPPGTQKPH